MVQLARLACPTHLSVTLTRRRYHSGERPQFAAHFALFVAAVALLLLPMVRIVPGSFRPLHQGRLRRQAALTRHGGRVLCGPVYGLCGLVLVLAPGHAIHVDVSVGDP